jgi:hypothetical protein
VIARVAKKRLALYLSTDALKIVVGVVLDFKVANVWVTLGVVLFIAAVVYLMLKRVQTCGLDGTITVRDRAISFGSGLQLRVEDLKDVRIETWRFQKLLVLEGYGEGALIYLPDVYDVPAEILVSEIRKA